MWINDYSLIFKASK